MENILEFEIKASNIEEALDIAKRENNLTDEYEIKSEELSKAKSFLGFINTKGLFKITAIKKVFNDKVKDQIEKLLSLMDINLECEVEKKSNNQYSVNLKGQDNGIIIGKKGKTLNSFEYLVNTLIRTSRVEIDVEGFKAKREETLIDLARKIAEKVIKTNKAVKLNAMPPAERKIIHSVLNEYEKLETYSEGKDPNRYIVVKLKKEELFK